MITAYTGTQVRAAEEPLLAAGRGEELMLRAAHGLATGVVHELRSRGARLYGASVVVLAGTGNNGGDGLYAAAFLAARGMRTTAVLTGDAAHPGGLGAFERAGGRVNRLTEEALPELAAEAARADVVIDAVLGTGAKGGLRGLAADFVQALAGARTAGRAQGLVVACDLPSGVDADSGETAGEVLMADLTVTFGGAKSGLMADPGADYAGRVLVVPIGIEEHFPQPSLRRLEGAEMAGLLPHPARRAHKYSRGVLGVVAGSEDYPGAAVLACRGALAAGAGMVRYLGPPSVAHLVRQSCPEVVCSTGSVAENRVQAWLVGSGMGPKDHDQLARAGDAVTSGLPVVADAGALPALPDTLAPHVVLTPHAGELASLFQRLGGGEDREAVEAGTLDAVRRAADRTGATVLLKGATTLVASPSGQTFSQADGTPWLATAGSGDVLAGVIGALLAQAGSAVEPFRQLGLDDDDRWAALAALGAALHGRAGTAASESVAGGPVTAARIAEGIPEIWGKVSMLSKYGAWKRNSHSQPLR
ncbi:NAD(P)H-hydrate dehydratase [Pseudarthrobacter sp. AG30]|uniref:NAD(P)H-hydrate dehydratase n=1 Tax=Pseudarthrobacter sp. AG30 TaxID=2249742 RepID=UPI000D648D2E|nr:NAD(P)H-hydrate dehydratase [Pseudarthrobacter sp. AG30]RAX18451.1 NAD(P)H-hydrate dehydratase [Pseudarthrobacter sp. AG30]